MRLAATLEAGGQWLAARDAYLDALADARAAELRAKLAVPRPAPCTQTRPACRPPTTLSLRLQPPPPPPPSPSY